MADDATPEVLATLIAENNGRLAIVSAEGTIFEMAAGRYSKSAKLEGYLAAHAGDPLRIDRRGRSEFVASPSLAMLVCGQRNVLAAIENKGQQLGRGFLARFFYALPRSLAGHRKTRTGRPQEHATAAYDQILDRLSRWRATEDERIEFELTGEALRAYHDWHESIEPRRAQNRDLGETPAIAGWAAKLHGQILRLAALFHIAALADEGDLPNGPGEAAERPVSVGAVEQAISLTSYLIAHARAAFGLVEESDEHRTLRELADWIVKQQSPVRWRSIYTRMRRKVLGADELREMLAVLTERGYIRRSGDNRGEAYEINPAAK